MPKENQRVVVTKHMLKEGVMKLLKKKHINDISVSELCRLSEINRTTFYRHYQTPHDVLLDVEFDFVESFCNIPVSPEDAADLKKYAARMCSFVYENKDIVKLFMQNNTDSDIILIFQNIFNEFLPFGKVMYRGHSLAPDALRLMQTFFAYGVSALLRQWISEDVPLTAEEVSDLVVGLVNLDFSFQ